MAVTNNYVADALFMTPQEVIDSTFTNKNTDVSLISSNCRLLTEQAHMIEPLGFDFYVHLKRAFQGGTETADEILLMTGWIFPCLALMTKFELILEIQNQSTSSGIVGNIPEFASLVSASDLNVYKQDTYRKGRLQIDAMVKFLNENTTEFPEYTNGGGSGLCNQKNGTIKTHGMIIY